MTKQLAWLVVCALLVSGCSYLPSWMGAKKAEKEKLPGDRITIISESAMLSGDPALKGVPPTLPAAIENTEWPQHGAPTTSASGHLAARSAGKDFLEKHESARAGDGNAFSHTLIPKPVVANGTVFSMDARGRISARSAADIDKKLWDIDGMAAERREDIIGGGLAYDANVLYATSGHGLVAAFDAATGNNLWRKEVFTPLRSAPLVAGGLLVVVTIDNVAYGLSTKTGDIAWEHRGIDETAGLMNNVSPAAAGDMVLLPYSSGELFALTTADGKEAWSDTLITSKHTAAMSSFAGIGGDPVVDGEAVFATSNNGITAAIHLARGQRLWQQRFASLNTPWLAGDELFILTGDNIVVDIAKYNGKIRWATPLASYLDPEDRLEPINWRGPVLMGGNLIVVGSHGKMLLISPTDGTITDTKDIPKNIFTAPVVASGRMYLIDQDANLHSFE